MNRKKLIKADEPISYDQVKDMTLLENCIREALRLRPPIIVIWRKVLKDFTFENYTIPSGTLVCVSPASYARLDDSVYKNPTVYDPDRFDPPRSEHAAAYAFFPFSAGRHACIGEKFAYLQVKTILAIILRNYELKLIGTINDYPVDNTSLLASPKGPIRLQYKRRILK